MKMAWVGVLGTILLIQATMFSAHAKIYYYVDEKGVIHLTNVPVGRRSFKAQGIRTKSSTIVAKTRSRRNTPVSHLKAGYYEKALDRYIRKIADFYKIDHRLVKAVIKAESGFDPHAVSPKGAIGLMQLMPDTAYEMGIINPYHPMYNLIGGVRYLKQMLIEFNNNLILALAAYNAGPQAVRKYGGIPPYKETRQYVRRVLRYYIQYVRNNS
ncbi:MAG TPA: DUF4124 domain-containing protein [Thermodesulforhabdus norvegica]|uniref:DUF4124 domain-containing protein n=1 Tax=Thermodesulforhabdus norvegica TaxID=39841 RepID=A0A7C0WU31_9BACT|nr:DUF4124 domain-containing protein [Thermodesulforhabdus norvegica]